MKSLQNSSSAVYKKCSRCATNKLTSEFHKKKGCKFGVRSECKDCISQWQKDHYSDPEINSKRIERQRDPEYRLQQRKSHLFNKYGLSLENYDNLLKSQNNCCAICEVENPGGRSIKYFHIDHCHLTNKIRQLLCSRCNTVLGLIEENKELLSLMSNYIEKHKI